MPQLHYWLTKKLVGASLYVCNTHMDTISVYNNCCRVGRYTSNKVCINSQLHDKSFTCENKDFKVNFDALRYNNNFKVYVIIK